MILAKFQTTDYEGEIREHTAASYHLIIRGRYIQKSCVVPKILRSGRAGLDVALNEIEWMIEERKTL